MMIPINPLVYLAHLKIYLEFHIIINSCIQTIYTIVNFLFQIETIDLVFLLIRYVLKIVIQLINHIDCHLLVTQDLTKLNAKFIIICQVSILTRKFLVELFNLFLILDRQLSYYVGMQL